VREPRLHTPLAGARWRSPGGALLLWEPPFAAKISLRASRAAAHRLFAAIGLPAPSAPLRAAAAGGRAALWLAPDEWLLHAPYAARQELLDAARALAGRPPPAAVDLSHRYGELLLAGEAAIRALRGVTPLDLDSFAPGSASRTLCGKVDAVLWREGADRFRFLCGRSFTRYLFELLQFHAISADPPAHHPAAD